ncbi:hypothetical protein KLEB273_gp246 [Bacillus phage vB_BauM_KLEB27-3]|nr:hypothetical protein KLEB273_gp246 [Bacillus phage vB_BauM_KLEB27-3]
MNLFEEFHGHLSPHSQNDERGLIFMAQTEHLLVNSFGYKSNHYPFSAFTKQIQVSPVPNNEYHDYILLISLESTSYKVYALNTHRIDTLFEEFNHVSDYVDVTLQVSNSFQLLLDAPYETYENVPFGQLSYEELYSYLSKMYEVHINPIVDRYNDDIRKRSSYNG